MSRLLTRVSRISISVSIELGNDSLPSHRISPVHLSRVSLDRGLSLERRGPRNGPRTDSCLIDTVLQVSSLNLYPRCRGWTASMEINGSKEGGEREKERKKSTGPPTRRSWFVRNARLSRENRDSRIIDTFQRVKKENSPSVGSIMVWSARNFESYCLGSLMRNRFLEKKNNNIYSNHKQR